MPPDPADRDAAALFDIVDSARWALSHAAGLSEDEFFANVLAQDGVIRRVLVIGEAARRLSHQFRNAHPEVPWPLITGMRNRLVHRYDEIDLERVWEVLDTDLRPLIAQLEPLLPPAPGPPGPHPPPDNPR